MIYETKGLSLEQVNTLYEIEPKAWKSASRHQELEAMTAREHGVRLNSIISEHVDFGREGEKEKAHAEHSD